MRRPPVSACVLTILVVQFACVGRAAAADPVIAAAGDIACAHDDSHYNGGAGSPGFCRQRATSDLMVGAGLAAVLPLGDIQYDSASATDLNLVYDPTWGRVKSISRPVLGNHEGAGADYFDYFNGKGVADGPAGQRGKGWYSFDVGSWHIVALNSNCGRVGCTAGSEQEQWLRADLAAHPTTCTLAYWHHPRYSSGHDGSNAFMQPLWQALDDGGAEIVLSGHSHDYERFAPLDPAVPGAGRRRHPPVRRGHRRRVLHRRPRHPDPEQPARSERHVRRPVPHAPRHVLRLAVRARDGRDVHGHGHDAVPGCAASAAATSAAAAAPPPPPPPPPPSDPPRRRPSGSSRTRLRARPCRPSPIERRPWSRASGSTARPSVTGSPRTLSSRSGSGGAGSRREGATAAGHAPRAQW